MTWLAIFFLDNVNYSVKGQWHVRLCVFISVGDRHKNGGKLLNRWGFFLYAEPLTQKGWKSEYSEKLCF